MPSDRFEETSPLGSPDGLAASPDERIPGTPGAGIAHQGRPATRTTGGRAMSLHVSKLRGISYQVRNQLKHQGVTYTHQLLEVAGRADRRHALATRSGIEEPTLMRLTCRADLARVKGIGAIFADMLELLGVDRVTRLARQNPASLHAALYELNVAERFARRAPTQEEVDNWVAQAQSLPQLVDPSA